jgi:hypothetical protein
MAQIVKREVLGISQHYHKPLVVGLYNYIFLRHKSFLLGISFIKTTIGSAVIAKVIKKVV